MTFRGFVRFPNNFGVSNRIGAGSPFKTSSEFWLFLLFSIIIKTNFARIAAARHVRCLAQGAAPTVAERP
jgi:hypothetical protein